MSTKLKKDLMTSLTLKNTGITNKQGCNMIKADACNTYDPYCKKSSSSLCVKKKGSPATDAAFYESIALDDLNIPFISPEFIFKFDKELSDTLLMEHARVYVNNREEYNRLMNESIYNRVPTKQYDKKLKEMVHAYRSRSRVSRVIEAPKQGEKGNPSKYNCGNLRPERCHKYKAHCTQDSPGEYDHEEVDPKTGETIYFYKDKKGKISKLTYEQLRVCRKKVGGPVLDEKFEKMIDQTDLLENRPRKVYNRAQKPVSKSSRASEPEHSSSPVSTASANFNSPPRPTPFIEEAPLASSQPDLTSLSKINVSPVVEADLSHLSKSGSDNSGTEAAIVAEIQEVPNLSRTQSIELIESPIVQHYLELHGHLSRAEFVQAKELLNAMYEGIKKIIASSDSKKVKQGKISDLLNSVDLCQYIRNGPKNKLLSVSELKKKITSTGELSKILESFGNIDNTHIYGLKIRSVICYIILSVVLMTPEEFVSKLTEFK
jgi:hypothetical protein